MKRVICFSILFLFGFCFRSAVISAESSTEEVSYANGTIYLTLSDATEVSVINNTDYNFKYILVGYKEFTNLYFLLFSEDYFDFSHYSDGSLARVDAAAPCVYFDGINSTSITITDELVLDSDEIVFLDYWDIVLKSYGTSSDPSVGSVSFLPASSPLSQALQKSPSPLQEVAGLIPIVLIVLIGLALRKALRMLFQLLGKA